MGRLRGGALKESVTCRLKKKTDGTLQTSTEHMHAPDTAKNESEKIKATIRERAENGVEKPRQIIVNSTAGVSLELKQPIFCCRIQQANGLSSGNERGLMSTILGHILFMTSFFRTLRR